MDADEERVKAYLEKLGFTCDTFSKEEKRVSKTPDFRVSQMNDFLFFCEVKSSQEDCWLDEQLESAISGEIVGGTRNDPIFNRLATHIHTALKQFSIVNPDEQFPNVLAMVNHDNNCGFNDLLGVLTGNFYADDGKAYPIYKQFSEGRIRDEKMRIHLFIWLDDFKPNQLLFSQTNEVLHLKLCQWFGAKPDEIHQIGS